jgi:hypothetical protein
MSWLCIGPDADDMHVETLSVQLACYCNASSIRELTVERDSYLDGTSAFNFSLAYSQLPAIETSKNRKKTRKL